MNRLQTSFFDSFGVFVPALGVITAADFLLGTNILVGASSGWAQFVAMLAFAYSLGQALGTLADWLFRGFLIGLLLRYPSENLFRRAPRNWYRLALGEYFAPFPDDIAARLNRRFEEDAVGRGEAQFLHAFGRVMADGHFSERLSRQQANYLFFQNSSLACLVIAAMSFMGLASHLQAKAGMLAFAAAVAAMVFFLRFLKCYRQFTVELYMAYDALPHRSLRGTTRRGELSLVAKDR